MQSAVLYEKHVPWLTGEHEADRDARIARGESGDTRERFPGFVPGRVISIVSADKGFSPGETAHPVRAVAKLDLTNEERQGLLSHCFRLRLGVAGVLGIDPVVFDEKWGAIAAELKVRFPLDYPVREKEEEEEEAAALVAFQAETEDWHASATEATELGLTFTTPPPAPPELPTEFRDTVVRLRKLLPPTVVHSGAGLYKVDGAGSTHNDTIAGFVENLCLQSEDFTTTWSNGPNSTITANQYEDPDGKITADKFVSDGVDHANYLQQSFSGVADVIYTAAIWVKLISGSPAAAGVQLVVYSNVLATVIEDIGDLLTSEWQRFDVTAQADGDGGAINFQLKANDACTLAVYGAQIEVGVAPSGYIHTKTTTMHAITLTTGGLVEDERNGEVLVTGGNSYPVIKAYAAQVNVIGDPTAEAGALTISPYTTLQSAHDQLWTDQGATNFAAEQEIRIYDDTYTEFVTLNSSLRPTFRYKFKVSAAAGNTAVVSTNTGLGAGHTWNLLNVDNITVTGITIKNEYGGAGYACMNGQSAYGTFIDDCALEVTHSGGYCFRLLGVACRNTILTGQGKLFYPPPGIFEGCEFHGGWIPLSGQENGPTVFRGCLFDGTYITIPALNPQYPSFPSGPQLFNCTIYNVATFLESVVEHRLDCRVVNCIFHTVSGYVFNADAGTGRIVSDRNCFHACTKIGRMNGTDYTTLAAWQTFTNNDGDSPDANSIEADPLLTDPGADDFSLQAGSPCRHAGHGSGVVYDYLGVAFDPNTPDIGAWSSGAAAAGGGRQVDQLLEQETCKY